MTFDELGDEPAERHDVPTSRSDAIKSTLDENVAIPLTPQSGDDLGVWHDDLVTPDPVVGDTDQLVIDD